jgi:hypothetical protein
VLDAAPGPEDSWQQAVQEASSVLGSCSGANLVGTTDPQAQSSWSAQAAASRGALSQVSSALTGLAALTSGQGSTQDAGCAGQVQELQHGLQQVLSKMEQLQV